MGVIGNILNRSSQSTSIHATSSSRATHFLQRNNHQISYNNNVDIPVTSENSQRKYSTSSISNSSCGLRISHNGTVNNKTMNQNQPQSNALSAETAAGAVPPLGLSGPNSFTFSPHISSDSKEKRSRYLSFVSSSIHQTRFRTTNIANKNERRLCVLDLEPFWEILAEKDLNSNNNSDESFVSGSSDDSSMEIDGRFVSQEKQRKLNDDECLNDFTGKNYIFNSSQIKQTSNHHASSSGQSHLQIPILNSNTVMKNHVDILLNSSSHSQKNKGNASTPPHPANSNHQANKYQSNHHRIESESESSLSLEERLRRERQRLHTSGVTQFTWGTYCHNVVSNEKTHEKQLQPKRMLTAPSPGKPVSHNSSTTEKLTSLRLLVPLRGNIYVQDGVDEPLRLVYDKSMLQREIQRIDDNSRSDSHRRRRHRNRETSGSVVGRDASAIDPQLSPDGSMVAFVVAGEIYVMNCNDHSNNETSTSQKAYDKIVTDCPSFQTLNDKPIRITYGAINNNSTDYYSSDSDCDDDTEDEYYQKSERTQKSTDKTVSSGYDGINNERPRKKRHGRCITHGLADFVAQEEMDRYRGFWWDNASSGILFARVDESCVAPYRITHQGKDGFAGDEASYEDHRYPFAGEANPDVVLGYVKVDRTLFIEKTIEQKNNFFSKISCTKILDNHDNDAVIDDAARSNWSKVKWFPPPPEASEYLARVNWLPDGTACAQWQDRSQSHLALIRINVNSGETMTLHTERSELWINLHHMFHILPKPVHPNDCIPVKPKHNKDSKLNSNQNKESRDLMEEDPSNQGQPFPAVLPPGSFSFLFASERSGYCHLYLYTYVPGHSKATLIRAVSAGDWMVESIVGLDMDNDVVYVTGTYTSPLEQHLYALPLINKHGRFRKDIDAGLDSSKAGDEYADEGVVSRGIKQVISTISGTPNKSPKMFRRRSRNIHASLGHEPLIKSYPIDPICLTVEAGVHNIQMDESCRMVVDTSSDLTRPPSTKVYTLPLNGPFSNITHEHKIENNQKAKKTSKIHSRLQMELLFVLFDAALDESAAKNFTNGSISFRGNDSSNKNDPFGYHVPELLSFPTSDGTETLHAALFLPDKKMHGPGPYPLICSVYGGPHVQRVNRSWSQCVDMRVQRLRSLGFAVVKCDNRGSSRRGLAFESSIRRRLGRLEVLDQVTAVRHLVTRGVADPSRVGIYGWSYGGYLAAMCLCRAPDTFHVAIAGAPVTSWDGYDTHYTERYMGLPHENPNGYNEAAVFDHIPNMRGKLMIVHGLIDENVHFRHTARLINRLVTAGKDYDLLIFPDERHSPRRLRDRIYMEKRISDYFIKNLLWEQENRNNFGNSGSGFRLMAGHL